MVAADNPQEYFRLILLTVVETAFRAAGYELDQNPIQWAGGTYRFMKRLDSGLYAYIAYQNLVYAEPNPSRFRVSLIRTDKPNPNTFSANSGFVRKTLSELVVKDFGVAILPGADHWWVYRNTTELSSGLAEAGHLIAGFGIPWLAGELVARG